MLMYEKSFVFHSPKYFLILLLYEFESKKKEHNHTIVFDLCDGEVPNKTSRL